MDVSSHDPMLLIVCPDTVAAHQIRLTEIDQQIFALNTKLGDIENTLYTDLRPKINAIQHGHDDACSKFCRIFMESQDHYLDLVKNWNLGEEMVQLGETVESLRKQKLLLEDDWRGVQAEIERFQDLRSIHVELIEALGRCY